MTRSEACLITEGNLECGLESQLGSPNLDILIDLLYVWLFKTVRLQFRKSYLSSSQVIQLDLGPLVMKAGNGLDNRQVTVLKSSTYYISYICINNFVFNTFNVQS